MRTLIGQSKNGKWESLSPSTPEDERRLKEIFESRRCPGSISDRELFRDAGTLAEQFSGSETVLNKMIATAKSHGYTPGTNDVYEPQLARFQGDPLAFIPPTGGRSHVKKVCELRGDLECEGLVNYKPPRYRTPKNAEDKGPRLAPDIVEEYARREATLHPEKRRMKKQELREQVIDKYGRQD